MNRSEDCLKAALIRRTINPHPDQIPEGSNALSFKDAGCPFQRDDGTECRLKNPMVFIKNGIGFTAIGTSNFCELEMQPGTDFKRQALGNTAKRVTRFVLHAFGRSLNEDIELPIKAGPNTEVTIIDVDADNAARRRPLDGGVLGINATTEIDKTP